MSQDRITELIDTVNEWASRQPNVMALALVGSYARGSARPDSDIDLVLIAHTPQTYLADLTWTVQFGEIASRQVEDYGRLTSVRVWYHAGPEVEFGITGEDWAATPLDEGTRQVIEDGMLVLFERGDILSRHQAGKRSESPLNPRP